MTKFERLTKSCLPNAYDITITPDVHQNIFYGTEIISISLTEPTQTFILNGTKLEVTSASCNNVACKNISYNETLELITIHFESSFKVGKVCLSLVFKGQLLEDMQGLYISFYTTESGARKRIVSTHFEPTFARKAYPCFDEPNMRATFKFSVIIQDHLTALSNMPELSRNPVDTPPGLPAPTKNRKYVKIEYVETPRMSTYITALVIGHLDYIAAKDTNGVEIRVYTPLNKTHLGEHGLQMAKSALPYYCDVFGSKYPLPKLDLVAIPEFRINAMENWGLVTYRETALLIDKHHSSLQSMRAVALVVSHELAHMWFGNFVTMEWWTHLWLKEGFANWIMYLAVDRCFPEYDIWNYFLIREFYAAMTSDQLKTSHPIEAVVNSPAEVDEIFDAVSYQKGASVIRMLNGYLGFETFCKGLQCYINEHMYGNTVTEDLWSALEKASGKPIQQIMSTWTQKMGFPVLSVRAGSYTVDGYSISIEQTRFLADGSADADDTNWYVPITICEAADSSKTLLKTVVPPRGSTKKEPFVVTIPVPADCDRTHPPAIRLNPGTVGFFRIQYDEHILSSIIEALRQGKLEFIDRLALLSDHFSLARAGRIPMVTALELAMTSTHEMDYTVWCELYTQLENIRKLIVEHSYTSFDDVLNLPKTSAEKDLDAYVLYLAKPIFKILGWTAKHDESNNNTLLRPMIISILGNLSYPQVVDEAIRLFTRHYTAVMNDSLSSDQRTPQLIAADLRMAVFSTVMHHGNETVYQKMLDLHGKATMNDESVRLLQCIGLAHSPEFIKKVINYTLSPSVRKQDRMHPLMALSAGPAGRRAVWAEVKKRIGSLSDLIGGDRMMGYVIRASCEGFCDNDHYKNVEDFFTKNPVPCARVIRQALESIAINTAILQRDGASMIQYLKNSQTTRR